MDGRPVVTQEGEVWVVRVERNVPVQEYRGASEAQARQLMLALTPKPQA